MTKTDASQASRRPRPCATKTDIQKKRVLAALRASNGVVTSACRAAKVDRSQFYAWRKEDPGFSAAVADTSEIALDFAETSLFRQIKRGDAAPTIFFLKTRGKARGYVERQEITGADGAPVASNPFAALDDLALMKAASDLLAKVNADSTASGS